MKKWIGIGAFILAAVAVAIAAYVFGILPGRLERGLNTVLVAPPYSVSKEARALHSSLFVADLHADSLLWNRDLSDRGARGQVDIPRLREGGVALQAFTAVTKSPEGQNFQSNSAEAPDRITGLVIAQRWPVRTWFSLCERARYQAQRLRTLAEEDEDLEVILTADDLRDIIARRTGNSRVLGAFLGIEGLHCLEGDLDNIDVLFDAGYRMMSPTHFFDNEMGGSAHGESNAGLTEFGRQAIQLMDERNIIIDIAHASPAMIDDILELTARPILSSHTGVQGDCDNKRNLSDAHVRAIAQRGGLIGIAFFDSAVCGEDAAAIAKTMKYVADLVGVEHVALGSDFDGAVDAPFDVTGLPLLTEALMEAGFPAGDIAKIMGGNIRDFLLKNLPE